MMIIAKIIFLEENMANNKLFNCNFGILFLVPYTKDFGKITQF